MNHIKSQWEDKNEAYLTAILFCNSLCSIVHCRFFCSLLVLVLVLIFRNDNNPGSNVLSAMCYVLCSGI